VDGGAARKALPRPAALRLSPQPCSSSEGAAACCRGRRLQRQFFRASPEACSISLEILALETWHARQRDPNTSASCSNSSELLSYRGWSSGATTLRLGERESRGISPRNFAEELPRGRSISSRCRVRVRVRSRSQMLSIRRRGFSPPLHRLLAVNTSLSPAPLAECAYAVREHVLAHSSHHEALEHPASWLVWSTGDIHTFINVLYFE